MKKPFKLLFVLLLVLALASCVTYDAEEVITEKRLIVEDIEGTASDIYIKTRSWMSETFVSSESVIDFENQEAGIIKGNWTCNISSGLSTARIRCGVTVECQDGRARITITPGVVEYWNSASYVWQTNSVVTENSADIYNSEASSLIASFALAMKSTPEVW